ncbi:hypothetical protein PROFUN_10242 [Planoprotostelium fungivorum]|uniref:Zn(2)-C6 fungal-type domain-containing protein n=1 Tax=Planoprotostelium fungivorum TaxID=1890364 RepID=A0A2P6NEF6_9EUKA|nr:hypothetical protein PROFUN_10242 [Planoprotostelium fungivorum]
MVTMAVIDKKCGAMKTSYRLQARHCTAASVNSDEAMGVVEIPSDVSLLNLGKRNHTSAKRNACAACRKSHVTCEDGRPCHRCNSKGIDCVDAPTKPRGGPKKKRNDANLAFSSEAPAMTANDVVISPQVNTMDGSSDIDQLWNMLMMPEEDVMPPSMHLQSPEERENFHTILAKSDRGHTIPPSMRPKFEMIRKKKESLRLHFDRQLEEYIHMASMSDTPIIIWERSFVVHYLNPPAIELLSWTHPLPDRERISLMHILSPDAALHIGYNVLKAYESNFHERGYFRSSFRNLKERVFTFRKANFVCTIKRDILGLPHLYIVQMLPDPEDERPPDLHF